MLGDEVYDFSADLTTDSREADGGSEVRASDPRIGLDEVVLSRSLAQFSQ